jgi:hypothetical protein
LDWMLILKVLEGLKEFLGNNMTLAFLTLSVALNVYLFRGLLKEKDAKFEVVVEWLPVVDDMQRLIGHAARKARSKNLPPPKNEGA